MRRPAHSMDTCGCFPTGKQYPGIADLLIDVPLIGMAREFSPHERALDLPFVSIDFETTGRDVMHGDRVIEMAIVCFDRAEVCVRVSLLFDPGIPIPPDSTAVHGITNADVRGMPRFENLALDIKAFLRGRVPVAYNASFDRQFLFAEMRRAGVTVSTDPQMPPALRSNVEWIDPLMWARSLQAGSKGFKLVEVAGRLGVPLTNAHRATDDAEAAGNVMVALLRSVEARDGKLSYADCVRMQREMGA